MYYNRIIHLLKVIGLTRLSFRNDKRVSPKEVKQPKVGGRRNVYAIEFVSYRQASRIQ